MKTDQNSPKLLVLTILCTSFGLSLKPVTAHEEPSLERISRNIAKINKYLSTSATNLYKKTYVKIEGVNLFIYDASHDPHSFNRLPFSKLSPNFVTVKKAKYKTREEYYYDVRITMPNNEELIYYKNTEHGFEGHQPWTHFAFSNERTANAAAEALRNVISAYHDRISERPYGTFANLPILRKSRTEALVGFVSETDKSKQRGAYIAKNREMKVRPMLPRDFGHLLNSENTSFDTRGDVLILIHGITRVANPKASFPAHAILDQWQPFIRRYLKTGRVHDYYSCCLIYFWDDNQGIPTKTLIGDVVEEILRSPGAERDIGIVGHSHGGNLARLALLEVSERNRHVFFGSWSDSTKPKPWQMRCEVTCVDTPILGTSMTNLIPLSFPLQALSDANRKKGEYTAEDMLLSFATAAGRFSSPKYSELVPNSAFLTSLNRKFLSAGLHSELNLVSAQNDSTVDNQSALWERVESKIRRERDYNANHKTILYSEKTFKVVDYP